MRIGIVNNLPGETGVLRQAIGLKPEHHIIWIGKTVAETMELCAKEMPDLILIGLLAGIDGVEATRRIMAGAPCAIVIVTDSVQTNAARIFEAMGYGALDVVDLPVAGNLRDSAVSLLARIAMVSHLIGETAARRGPVSGVCTGAGAEPQRHPLIAIGASAGGPSALATLLRGLPKDFPAAIVVIQHIAAEFAVSMAEWLSEQAAVPVTVAREGESPAAGSVLLAGTSDHLTLKSANRLGYTPEPREYVYRPSVDVLFASVSRLWQGDAVGVLLTGMGNDGAQGLKALRNRGHHTIAQDEATSAVYGMPKAAAALEAAVEILPMERIAPRLVELVAAGPRLQSRVTRQA